MKTQEEMIAALTEAHTQIIGALANMSCVQVQVLSLIQDLSVSEHATEKPARVKSPRASRLPHPPYKESLKRRVESYRKDILRLHNEGLHITGIASAIDLHRDTVTLYMQVLEITPNKAKGKNKVGGRKTPLAPTEKEQNENLKQNPWETTDDS